MGKYIFKYVLLFVFFMVFTSLFAFYMAIRPPKIQSNFTPDQFGLEYEDIALVTSDNLSLAGWFVPNEKSEKAIILMHGYPADKGDILPSMHFLVNEYNLLFFDFRSFGQSEGKISYLGAKEPLDLEAAIKFLESRGVDEIGLWGFSFGASVALMGAQHPHVKAVIADSSYAKLSMLAPQLFRIPLLDKPLGYLSILWGRIFVGINAFAISPVDAVKDSQKPIFIIHSQDDEVIYFEHALLLASALSENPNAEFWFTTGVHGLLGAEYENRIAEFFKNNL